MAGVKGRSGGHNRKSRTRHVLEGTYRPDRHGAVTPAAGTSPASPKSRPPGAPASLSAAGKAAWRRAMTEFEAWTAPELLLLELALQAGDRAEECRRRLATEGLVLRGSRGSMKLHPLIRVERTAAAVMLDVFKRLGLDRRDDDA